MAEVDEMAAEDYVAWSAYHSLYPIDGSREDYRNAINCQITAAAFGGEVDIEDCIPKFGEPQTQPIEMTIAYFQSLAKRKKPSS